MKQKIALLLSFVMLAVTLVACGRKNKTHDNNADVIPGPTVSDTDIRNDAYEGGGAGGTDDGMDHDQHNNYDNERHDHEGVGSDLIHDGETIIDDTLDGIGDAIDDVADGVDNAVTRNGQNTGTTQHSK